MTNSAENPPPPKHAKKAEEAQTKPTATESPAALSPSTSSRTDDSKRKKKKRTRCQNCKKKVGLTGFACRCGGVFCELHRYSDKHACPYDYKKEGAKTIRKNNPVVVAKKIPDI